MAYEIVKGLRDKDEKQLLGILSQSVSGKDRLKNKKHKVWRSSFDWKECRTNDFIIQKLDYIHLNPCSGKWNLSHIPEEYEHSSAKFYICGMEGIYPVTNYLALDDIDFT